MSVRKRQVVCTGRCRVVGDARFDSRGVCCFFKVFEHGDVECDEVMRCHNFGANDSRRSNASFHEALAAKHGAVRHEEKWANVTSKPRRGERRDTYESSALQRFVCHRERRRDRRTCAKGKVVCKERLGYREGGMHKAMHSFLHAPMRVFVRSRVWGRECDDFYAMHVLNGQACMRRGCAPQAAGSLAHGHATRRVSMCARRPVYMRCAVASSTVVLFAWWNDCVCGALACTCHMRGDNCLIQGETW